MRYTHLLVIIFILSIAYYLGDEHPIVPDSYKTREKGKDAVLFKSQPQPQPQPQPQSNTDLQKLESTGTTKPEKKLTVKKKSLEYDVEEVACMALNIYHESRGESYNGKIAVASVVMNRVKSDRFPNTPCEVITQSYTRVNWKGNIVPILHKCQFSWYCDGKSDQVTITDINGNPIKANVISWEESNQVAVDVLTGKIKDNTHGATHYFNPKLASPSWANEMTHTITIEDHTFFRE